MSTTAPRSTQAAVDGDPDAPSSRWGQSVAPFRRYAAVANTGGVGSESQPRLVASPINAITSYGIICYRLRSGHDPEYIMVQRKDSMSYVEFLRGKYRIGDRTYLCKLLSNMTRTERNRLVTQTFHDLWQAFWLVDNPRNFEKDYNNSHALFERLRAGYSMHLAGQSRQVVHVSLDILLSITDVNVVDGPEWGFPKGRRNVDESDLGCAIREFREETGIDATRHVTVYSTVRPFEEIFMGSNKVSYRHVYYLAQLSQAATLAGTYDGPHHDAHSLTTSQQREIGAIRWCDSVAVHERIRDENVRRREVFERVHDWVRASVVPTLIAES